MADWRARHKKECVQASGAGAGDWADSAESNNRQMLDLCRRVNTQMGVFWAGWVGGRE